MPNQIALEAAGGSFSALVLSLIRHLAFRDPLPPLPLNLDCVCPTLGIDWEQPAIQFFLAGLQIGILLGPAIDLLWLIRERWRRFVLTSLYSNSSGTNKPLFKVVNE